MKRPADHLPPRRALGDVRGSTTGGERLTEYFDFTRWPDKAGYRVTRMELLAIVTQIERARQARTLGGFLTRLGRWIMRPIRSKPLDASGKEMP